MIYKLYQIFNTKYFVFCFAVHEILRSFASCSVERYKGNAKRHAIKWQNYVILLRKWIIDN